MSVLEYVSWIPWGSLEEIREAFRSGTAVEWPEDDPTVELETTHDRVEAALRDDCWEGCPYSLEYEGEVLNLRRPAGRDDDGTPLEDHIRTRDHPERDGVVEAVGHREASRYEAEDEHLDETHIRPLGVVDITEAIRR